MLLVSQLYFLTNVGAEKIIVIWKVEKIQILLSNFFVQNNCTYILIFFINVNGANSHKINVLYKPTFLKLFNIYFHDQFLLFSPLRPSWNVVRILFLTCQTCLQH